MRISSAEKLRREKEVDEAVGVVCCCVRSIEATGVRVFDEEGEEEAELRFRLRKKEKERLFDDDDDEAAADAETAESLFETATRGEEGQEMGEGGKELLLSYSLGVVVVMETGVAVPGVEEAEEEEEGSMESLLRLESEEDELKLEVSKTEK